MSLSSEAIKNIVSAIAFALAFLAIWEAAVIVFSISQFALPRPSQIFSVLFVDRYSYVFPHILQTTYVTLAGFLLGVGTGFVLGVIIGSSRVAYSMIYPTLVGINSIPKVAFVPVFAIWFGVGEVPAILTAMIICVFPVVVVVATSIATVEPELIDVLRSLGANKLQILRKVGVPQSMPYFFGSLKIAITLSFVGAVTAETVAANRGIGYMLVRAASDFDVILVFAGLIAVSVMGVVFYTISVLIERRVSGWAFRTSEGAVETA